MLTSRNLLSGKRKYWVALIFLSFISVVSAAFSITDSDGYATAKTEVVLRRIGDELLLQSGDSISRVLPVKKIADNEYQISFEKEFAFLPDSLVNISRRLLGKDYPQDYIVTVLNCNDSSVAHGYAISKNKKEDIIACRGRKQPVGCYRINIKWEPTEMHTAKNIFLLGSLPFLAFVGFIFLKSVSPRKALPDSKPTTTVTLGSLLFDAKDKKLIKNGETIDLTGTETRILLILALSPNETIERSRLQKEIWEDDGVIVGRSLDMFISKLRKKLEWDPNIKIAVIRGKGYRLETNV